MTRCSAGHPAGATPSNGAAAAAMEPADDTTTVIPLCCIEASSSASWQATAVLQERFDRQRARVVGRSSSCRPRRGVAAARRSADRRPPERRQRPLILWIGREGRGHGVGDPHRERPVDDLLQPPVRFPVRARSATISQCRRYIGFTRAISGMYSVLVPASVHRDGPISERSRQDLRGVALPLQRAADDALDRQAALPDHARQSPRLLAPLIGTACRSCPQPVGGGRGERGERRSSLSRGSGLAHRGHHPA